MWIFWTLRNSAYRSGDLQIKHHAIRVFYETSTLSSGFIGELWSSAMHQTSFCSSFPDIDTDKSGLPSSSNLLNFIPVTDSGALTKNEMKGSRTSVHWPRINLLTEWISNSICVLHRDKKQAGKILFCRMAAPDRYLRHQSRWTFFFVRRIERRIKFRVWRAIKYIDFPRKQQRIHANFRYGQDNKGVQK